MTVTVKDRVFSELKQNPLLTPSQLCRILLLDYKKVGHYIQNLKTKYHCHLKNGQAPKCPKYHNARGWVSAPVSLSCNVDGSFNAELAAASRKKAVAAGWVLTGSKNRMLLYRSKLGRLEWFETGRVNFWLNKPASWAKAKQLLAYGFLWTKLVEDIDLFESWSRKARFKGAHLVYDTGELLPYAKVDILKESNGCTVKMGDVSHPTALEIEFCYPDWAERQENVSKKTTQVLENLMRVLELNTVQTQRFNEFMADLNAPKNGVVDDKTMKRLYE